MRFALLALGSRGDVQPFIALALALQRAGHTVRLVGLADYAPLVAAYGLPYAPVVGAAAELMDRELVLAALDSAGGLPLGFALRFVAQITPLVTRLCADCLAACAGADAIVASTLGLYPGLSLAEALGVPLVPAHFHPLGATRGAPDLSFAPLPPWAPLAAPYNLATHVLAAHGLWQLLRPALNRARRAALGLPPLGPLALRARVCAIGPLALYGYSPLVAPPPPDWPPERRVTGYWHAAAPPAWAPPAALERFLASGPPPVYVGFGSVLAGRDPAAITAMLADALGRAGARGLIYRGAWDDLGRAPLPDTVLAIDAAPHDWLFARVAAVVTHGGAGTTAAALRAGVPVVVVPFFGDQRFWGRRVAALGAGPPPIPRPALTADALAAAIQRATGEPAMRARTRALAADLAAENGAARAAELLVAACDTGSPVHS